MLGGEGSALGVLWGVGTTITPASLAVPMPGYNCLTDLLEIQMKDIVLAIIIGFTLCAALLHGFGALFF